MVLSRAALLLILACILSSMTSIASDNEIREQTTSIEPSNSNTPATSPDVMPKWAGFIGCLVASVFFGSNLLPVKQFSAGDGFFFQFVFCVAVWLVGLILDVILNNQRFYPLVIVGGTEEVFVH